MSREGLNQPEKPLAFTVSGSYERLFQQLFAAGRKNRIEFHQRRLGSKLEIDSTRGKVILHQVSQSSEKDLFLDRVIMTQGSTLVGGKEGWDTYAEFKLNHALVPENFENQEAVEKLTHALQERGYAATLEDFDEKGGSGGIVVPFQIKGEGKCEAVVTFHEGAISMSTDIIYLNFSTQEEYQERIGQVQDVTEKFLRFIEATAEAIAKNFATEPPIPQTIEIKLPE